MNADARAALIALRDGNARFVQERHEHPRHGHARRRDVAPAQRPIAAVVSCSDSRVPPEIVFDQGLGDLFVVRTAGHVLDDIAIGSIEYAAEHLKVPLVVVMGHTSCGAVRAACQGGRAPGYIARIIDALAPSVEEARKGKSPSDVVETAARINVRHAARTLIESRPILSSLVDAKRLSVIGAIYDLETGRVKWLL